ncbi:uncharacterized protein MEPE_04472 [Melanopsichium pennsylvanicum]|uniref:Uncharacterized protein n=2 Tax=Melanopsichium pennsylvanicum TaxID=63383 RepID=A0AAJ4XRI6_9BASI|nr:putative protein [Melanopsichium pennsylvanicum 4]SNX85763.1 uncharacterized protein MEPE_04472 [Melanopsichium pennsylvanicum]
MLQPAAITSLLTQLISQNQNDPTSIKPHTALLTLLDSSELYAAATRLVDSPPPRSAVASILASTAAAAGTTLRTNHPHGQPLPLTLDERAACLSAIAVTSWRQATRGKKLANKNDSVALPGSSISVAKHAVTGMTIAAGKKAFSRELVPLLLESDLGRILVMPIVPAAPELSHSRSELAAMDELHEDVSQISAAPADQPKPFMLLVLNAPSDGPPADLPTSPSPSSHATSGGAALGNSTVTLSATQPARSRLRSGGTTPTSVRTDNTLTPSRSPVSDHFPSSSQSGPAASTGGDAETVEGEGKEPQGSAVKAEQDAWEAKVWSGLYAQAKALARVVAPSLTKCGVGHHHHADDHHTAGEISGRHSVLISDDEADS